MTVYLGKSVGEGGHKVYVDRKEVSSITRA